jgi:RNA polymerase-binding protein DksA
LGRARPLGTPSHSLRLPGPEGLLSVDVQSKRAELLDLRSRLLATTAALEHDQSLDDESGEIPAWGPDELADHASDTYEREVGDSLEENAEQILREVDDALARIDEGTYGVCKACGKEIPSERLEAVPYATLCVEDKRRLERG